MDELEASDNPFALVVMAQLQAKLGSTDEARKVAKFHLMRLLYERGCPAGRPLPDPAQVLGHPPRLTPV